MRRGVEIEFVIDRVLKGLMGIRRNDGPRTGARAQRSRTRLGDPHFRSTTCLWVFSMILQRSFLIHLQLDKWGRFSLQIVVPRQMILRLIRVGSNHEIIGATILIRILIIWRFVDFLAYGLKLIIGFSSCCHRTVHLSCHRSYSVIEEILKREWPTKWQSFVPDLVSAAKTSETICENCMAILKVTSISISLSRCFEIEGATKGYGVGKKDGDLNDGVIVAQPSNLADQQLTIGISQTTLVEPSSFAATKSDRGKGKEHENDENTEQRIEKSDESGSETEGGNGEEGEEGDDEGSGSEGTNGGGNMPTSGSGGEDDNEKEDEGSESGENDEEGQSEDGEKSKKEVVEVRPSAKARGKAKSGPFDKVEADDSFKPFPDGPIN
ncbi:hypothetical protein Syun_028244 [Stephania yunnanensis]|uniref:Exportin-1/Importin-beta-like domain-containing protein n=1 Tax=Stephania yunnanensis TaxID=152371 RepID=A0AAP0EML5_9MAGN